MKLKPLRFSAPSFPSRFSQTGVQPFRCTFCHRASVPLKWGSAAIRISILTMCRHRDAIEFWMRNLSFPINNLQFRYSVPHSYISASLRFHCSHPATIVKWCPERSTGMSIRQIEQLPKHQRSRQNNHRHYFRLREVPNAAATVGEVRGLW